MNNLILLSLLLTLSSCSILYAPKYSQAEDDKELCNKACNISKDACTNACSKTATPKECTNACDIGFSSCIKECSKTENPKI